MDACIDNYSQPSKTAVIARPAIIDRVRISDQTEIRDSIIGRHVTINSNSVNVSKISRTSVIAEDTVIDEGCYLITTKVYPHKHVRKDNRIENFIIT